MDFISLLDVLANMADCINLPPHSTDRVTSIGTISKSAADIFWRDNNPAIERARKISIAAMTLNKALNDSSDIALQWMEFDNTRRFAVRANSAGQEGLEMLTHATGWGSRKLNNCSTHFYNSICMGDDALALPVNSGVDEGLTIDGKLLRLAQIGFDRDKLADFLSKNKIPHSLGGLDEAAGEDYFTPLEGVAAYLALKQCGDETLEESALSKLKYLNVTAGKYTPVMAMRVLTELEIQRNIDALVVAHKVPLYSSLTYAPTRNQDGAFVRVSELVELIMSGAHLASADDVVAPPVLPAATTSDDVKPLTAHLQTEPTSTTHKIGTRNQVLDAEIKEAKRRASSDDDVHSIWAELAKMAIEKWGCLLAHSETDEVKYGTLLEPKFFIKKNFGGRLSRARTRQNVA